MQKFAEGNLTFEFEDHVVVVRPQDSTFYRKQWQGFATPKGQEGNKETDFVILDPEQRAIWLVESKDYRNQIRTKPSSLGFEFAQKCRDTLGWLAAVGISNLADASERSTLKPWHRAESIHCVLHVEQGQRSGALPPVIDPKTLRDLVKINLRALDPHAKSGDAHDLARSVPFTITV